MRKIKKTVSQRDQRQFDAIPGDTFKVRKSILFTVYNDNNCNSYNEIKDGAQFLVIKIHQQSYAEIMIIHTNNEVPKFVWAGLHRLKCKQSLKFITSLKKGRFKHGKYHPTTNSEK